jgi:hypothetical protein
MRRHARATFLGAVLLMFAYPARAALPPACDPDIAANAEAGPNGYHWRGDRCEGAYRRPVAGDGSFLVASLTRGRSARLTTSDLRIPIRWKPGVGGPLHVRAYPLRPRAYYQMDTLQPAETGRYAWPSDVLTGLGLPLSDIGLVAWGTRSFATHPVDVYVPIQLGDDTQTVVETTLIALSGREMNEVYVTVERLNEDGSRHSMIRNKRPLRYGSYAAQAGIEIALPELRAPGLYGMQIQGDVRSGGAVATRTIVISV